MRILPWLPGVTTLAVLAPALAAGPRGLALGPLVGAVDHQSARILVRTEGDALVHAAFSTRPDLAGATTTAPTQTLEDRDHTAHLELDGLRADTRYHYEVLVDGTPQLGPPYPSFVTFPPPAQTTAFSFVAMADISPRPHQPVYEAVERDLRQGARFLVQLGDFPHGNRSDLAGFRQQYRSVLGSPDFARVGPFLPLFHTWDDHDFGLNNSDRTWMEDGGGGRDSLRAFVEYFPTPPLAEPERGVWHAFRFAQAEFLMLDTRSQRDPVDAPAPRSMLGERQRAWLEDRLVRSDAAWKFLVSAVPWNPTAKPSDSWGAYPEERREILDFIAEHGVTNVIVLSGDIHAGGRIDDGTHGGLPELNVPDSRARTRDAVGCSGPAKACGTWSHGNELTQVGGYGIVRVETDPTRVVLEVRDWRGAPRVTLSVAAH